MNELRRQHYLSALGVDTYMPRWLLPFAPMPVACELPDNTSDIYSGEHSSRSVKPVASPQQIESILNPRVYDPLPTESSPVNHLIGEMLKVKETAKPAARLSSAADILAQLNIKPATVEPFSLSVWRPLEGVMIVDSRKTQLALPTELFLNNILRAVFSNQEYKNQEEILRWPMIENSFAKRTAKDARNELQTWLSVQHEIRPVRYLWLMGVNAATYLLPDSTAYNESLYKIVPVTDFSIQALVMPSLNEILQSPSTKQKLFSALGFFHSVS